MTKVEILRIRRSGFNYVFPFLYFLNTILIFFIGLNKKIIIKKKEKKAHILDV